MTDDKLSFLDAKPADKDKVEEAVTKTAPEAEVKTPPIVETKTEPVVIPPAAEPPAQPKGDGHTVPLPKYLDTQADLREARKRIAEFEEKEKEKAETPDPILDPEGYKAAQDKALDERLWDVRVNTSEIAARRFYGEKVVKAAFEALQAQNDPLLGMRIRRSADPWEEIVKWHKKELLLAEVGDDSAAYKAKIIKDWQEAQAAEQANAPPAPTTPATPAIPPASLTKAPSGPKASEVPVGAGNAFDTVFAR